MLLFLLLLGFLRSLGVDASDSGRNSTRILFSTEFRTQADANYQKLLKCLKQAYFFDHKSNVEYKFPEDAQDHYQSVNAVLKKFRKAQVHSYRKYYGPWIENVFITHFENRPIEDFGGLIPLFVPWVDNQKTSEHIWEDLFQTLKRNLRPGVLYFAVSQSDIGLARIGTTFPNILVLSGGGFGHVPIPLIKGEITARPLPPAFDQDIGFFGNMQQATRPQMFEIIRKVADEIGLKHHIAFGPTWQVMMSKSKFNLAPRGYGRSSFRFAEAIQIGRVPAFLYDNIPWVPYDGSGALDIMHYGFVGGLNETKASGNGLDSMVRKFKAVTPEQYQALTKKVESIRTLFTYRGVMQQIELMVKDPFGADGGYLRCVPHPKPEHEIL